MTVCDGVLVCPGRQCDGVTYNISLQPPTSHLQPAQKMTRRLTDGVVTAREVIGSVLLPGNQLLRVEELAVGAGAHLVDDSGLQINEDSARHMLAGARLGEERVERVIASADRLVRRHLPIGLDAVLETEQLPAGISDLNTGLADVNAESFTHCC